MAEQADKQEFISTTVTLTQSDIDYVKDLMERNDLTRSQVIRSMIREHRSKNQPKKEA